MTRRTWEQQAESFARARRTRYMNGWDAVLMGKKKNDNPYSRRDWKDQWDKGFDDCTANKPLPFWFDEWKAGKK
jgi:hypothetical protein